MSAKRQNIKLSLVILRYFLEHASEWQTPLALTRKLKEEYNLDYPHSTVWLNLQLLCEQEFLFKEAENFKLKNTIQKSCYDAWNKQRAQFLN